MEMCPVSNLVDGAILVCQELRGEMVKRRMLKLFTREAKTEQIAVAEIAVDVLEKLDG